MWLQNFSPLAAICLCGAIYLPRKAAVLLPLGIIFVSDVIINTHMGRSLLAVEMFSRYLALGLAIGAGWMIREHGLFVDGNPGEPCRIGGVLCDHQHGLVGFRSGIPKSTFAGLMQSLTTGLPGYAPTWMFFRSTFVSDLLFTGLFVLCMVATGSRASELRVAGRPVASVS